MTSKAILLAAVFFLFTYPLRSQDLGNISRQQPVKFSGSLELRCVAYNMQGMDARRQPFTWYLFGSPTLTLYGFSIPFSFALSKESQTYSQPFNQYGLSPHYKWITLHLGYRSLNFSPYTLAGHMIYGAGLELTPGKLRLGIMYGRLNKATSIDSSTGYVRPVSFTRRCLAMKIGVGSRNTHFDLSLLQAQDDSTSASQEGMDSSHLVLPAANIATSANLRIQLSRQLYFESDAGLSLYTTNMNNPHKIEELARFEKYLPINLSTQQYKALSASLNYKIKYFALRAAYKWIDPGFRSMGAYFSQNDVEQISLSPSFQLFKSRVRISGSVGWQHDNLRDQKVMTTDRSIWSAMAGIDFSRQLGLDLNLSNYSTNSKPEVTKLNNKYKLTNTNRNYAITPRYIRTGKELSHMIIGSYNLAELTDANDTTSYTNNITNQMIFLTYNVNLLRQSVSVNSSVSHTTTTFQDTETVYLGLSLGGSKSFFNNKLQTGLNIAHNISRSENGANVTNISINAQYSPARHHRFYIRLMVTDNTPIDKTIAPAFTETTGEVGYNFTF